MKCYVIKYKDGYSYAGNNFTKNLTIASCYESRQQCENVIKYYNLKDCEIIEAIVIEKSELNNSIKTDIQ